LKIAGACGECGLPTISFYYPNEEIVVIYCPKCKKMDQFIARGDIEKIDFIPQVKEEE